MAICRKGGRHHRPPFGVTFASRHSLETPAGILAAVDALFGLLAKGTRRAHRGRIAVSRDDVKLALNLCELALRSWTAANPAKAAIRPDGAPTSESGLRSIADL